MKITPNIITLARIVLAVCAIVLLLDRTLTGLVLAFFVFTAAGLSDIWDGVLARRSGQITSFGKIMDPIADKILVLGVLLTYSSLGLYSFYLLLPILIRECAVTLIRLYLVTKNVVIQAEKSGKLKVISQMVSVFFTFLYLLTRDYLHIAETPAYILNILCLALATWFSLISGVDFLRKNWKLVYE